MSGPNAFSMRRAISGVSAALRCRRSESVARRAFNFRRLGHIQTDGFDDFGPNESARMGPILQGHFGLLTFMHICSMYGYTVHSSS